MACYRPSPIYMKQIADLAAEASVMSTIKHNQTKINCSKSAAVILKGEKSVTNINMDCKLREQ